MVTVYIPQQSILEDKKNYMDILKAIPPEELLKKQLAIEKIAPRLQYSVVPASIQDGQTWESPVYDAVDLIVDKVLDRQTIEPIEGFSAEELIRQKCLQNDIMQNHADYAGLFPGKTKGDAGSNVAGRIWNKNKCQNYTRGGSFQGSTFSIEW